MLFVRASFISDGGKSKVVYWRNKNKMAELSHWKIVHLIEADDIECTARVDPLRTDAEYTFGFQTKLGIYHSDREGSR